MGVACRRQGASAGISSTGSRRRGPGPGAQGAAKRSAVSVGGAESQGAPRTAGRGFVTEAGDGQEGATGHTLSLQIPGATAHPADQHSRSLDDVRPLPTPAPRSRHLGVARDPGPRVQGEQRSTNCLSLDLLWDGQLLEEFVV